MTPRTKLKLKPHWVFAALRDMRESVGRMKAEAHGSSQYSDSTKQPHLRWMIDQASPEKMSATKANRWLGWIQACVVVAGAATLDEMKALNKRASDASERAK